MKRLIAGAAAVLTLSACSVGDISIGPPELMMCGGFETGFTAVAVIEPLSAEEEKDELTFGGQLCRQGGGFWEMSIEFPETLAGMTISAADDTITASLGELSFDASADGLPDKAPITTIFNALDNASARIESGASPEKGDDGWVVAAEDCTVIFDDNGIPLSMAAGNVIVEFSDFSKEKVTDNTESITE